MPAFAARRAAIPIDSYAPTIAVTCFHSDARSDLSKAVTSAVFKGPGARDVMVRQVEVEGTAHKTG